MKVSVESFQTKIFHPAIRRADLCTTYLGIELVQRRFDLRQAHRPGRVGPGPVDEVFLVGCGRHSRGNDPGHGRRRRRRETPLVRQGRVGGGGCGLDAG